MEKRVKKEVEKTSKKGIQQVKKLQEYLKRVDKTPYFSDKEIIKLWDELGEKIKQGGKKEISQLEKKIFKANLKNIVSISKEYRNKPYIKPYFTLLEVIKEGEKGLLKAIHNYKWPQERVLHKTAIARSAIIEQINESTYRKRWKIVTGKDYQGKFSLVSIAYVGHPILDNTSLRFAERMLTNKNSVKQIKKRAPLDWK